MLRFASYLFFCNALSPVNFIVNDLRCLASISLVSSGRCVYHLESHGICFMLRASKAEVVGIDVIVVPGTTLGPMSEPKHWLTNALCSLMYLRSRLHCS